MKLRTLNCKLLSASIRMTSRYYIQLVIYIYNLFIQVHLKYVLIAKKVEWLIKNLCEESV